jgi:aspartate aminotransferase-like enzyme
MRLTPEIPAARDKLLFTPGPLTTSQTVKQAMLRDAGSWHSDFNALVAGVRSRLLSLAGLTRQQGWEAVLLQGSGAFGVESVFQPGGHVSNCQYWTPLSGRYGATRRGHRVSPESNIP